MVDYHALLITGKLWIMLTSETLLIHLHLKKILSHYQAPINSSKAIAILKLASCTVPSSLSCTDQVTVKFSLLPYLIHSIVPLIVASSCLMSSKEGISRSSERMGPLTPTFALRRTFIDLQSLLHPEYLWICFSMLRLRFAQSHLLLLCPAHTTTSQRSPSANTLVFTDWQEILSHSTGPRGTSWQRCLCLALLLP